MKITSKDCIEHALTFPDFAATKPSYWKRISKTKNGIRILRTFKVLMPSGNYQNVVIVEENGKLLAPLKTSTTPTNIIEQLKTNPITVDFNTKDDVDNDDNDDDDLSPNATARIIYALSEDGLETVDYSGEKSFSFYCGRETTEGYLYDNHDEKLNKKLATLFSDFPKHPKYKTSIIEIGSAESHHTVIVPDNSTAKELWKIIETRLKRSGAKKMAPQDT